MFALSPALRFYLYTAPTDMRMGFDSLCGLISSRLQADAASGQVFVFINRRRTHLKLLQWQRGGFVLYHKRLEAGTFEVPKPEAGQSISLSYPRLVMLVEGISAPVVTYRKRYDPTSILSK